MGSLGFLGRTEGLLPGVEHEPGRESITQRVRQMAESAGILRSNGGTGFDLNSYHSTVRGLDHHVDLDLVFGAVMVQSSSLLRPGQLSGQLHGDEVLHQGARRRTTGIPSIHSSWPMRCPAMPVSTNPSFGVPIALRVWPEDQAGIVLMRKTEVSSSR